MGDLSRGDREAVIFKKIIEGQNLPFKHFRNLPELQQALAYKLIDEKDLSRRSIIFEREAISSGWIDLVKAVKTADPGQDLDQLQALDSWVFEGFSEIYKPLPPQEWVVEGMLPKQSVTVVYGSPKSLKTMLIMSLAISAAAGLAWLPGLAGGGFKTIQTPVLWCDFENGRRRVIERAAALGRAAGVLEDAPFFFVSMPHPPLRMDSESAAVEMLKRIEIYKAGLLIIDHLAQTLGEVSENDAEMSEVLFNYRLLAEESGAAILFVHHKVKSRSNRPSTAEAIRGHGAILAGCDLALEVERDKDTPNGVNVRPVAERGAPINGFMTFFHYTHKENTKELERAYFSTEKVESLNDKVDAAILAIIQGSKEKLNQVRLIESVKERVKEYRDGAMVSVATSRVRQAIARLENQKRISWVEGPKKSQLYSLVGSDG